MPSMLLPSIPSSESDGFWLSLQGAGETCRILGPRNDCIRCRDAWLSVMVGSSSSCMEAAALEANESRDERRLGRVTCGGMAVSGAAGSADVADAGGAVSGSERAVGGTEGTPICADRAEGNAGVVERVGYGCAADRAVLMTRLRALRTRFDGESGVSEQASVGSVFSFSSFPLHATLARLGEY